MSTLCYVAANSFIAGNGIAKSAERASGGIHQLRGLTKIEREDASDSPSLGFYFSFSASGLLCLCSYLQRGLTSLDLAVLLFRMNKSIITVSLRLLLSGVSGSM